MTASKSPKVREVGSRRRRRDLSWRRFGVSSVVFVVVLAGLLYSVYGLRPDSLLVVGAPSPQTFLAPQELSVTDEVATARERQAAGAQVGTIYSSVPELQELVLDEIARSPVPPRVKRFLKTAYERPQGVSGRGLELLIAEAAALAPAAARPRVEQALSERLLPSAEPNARSSEAARVAAAASVTPVLRSLEAGEVIVARGEPLSENTLSVLESVGLYNPLEEVLEQGLRLGLTSVLLALLLSAPLLYFYTALRESTTVGQRSFLALLWARRASSSTLRAARRYALPVYRLFAPVGRGALRGASRFRAGGVVGGRDGVFNAGLELRHAHWCCSSAVRSPCSSLRKSLSHARYAPAGRTS